MQEENELTYEEHYNAKIKVILEEYNNNIKSCIRNVIIEKDELDKNGLLTKEFLKSNKLNNFIMNKLTALTNDAKEKIEQYTI